MKLVKISALMAVFLIALLCASCLKPDHSLTTIYIVAESHAGIGQEAIFNKLENLNSETGIDAIFTELPDNEEYNWSKFESLTQDKPRALRDLK